MTKWLTGAALVVAVAAAAGCGGGGGGAPLSKSDFIAQADAICTDAHTKEQAIQFPSTDPQSATAEQLKKLGDAIDEATVVDRKEISDLRKLKPPTDFQNGFDESLNELSDGLDHAEKASAAAKSGDKKAVTSELAAVEAKANEANDRARTYGLKVCGGTS